MTTIRNRILRTFAETSPGEYAKFAASIDDVALTRGVILGTTRTRTTHVYFVESGIVSLVATTTSGHSLDVALIGSEGVAGIADALGQYPLPYAWMVQLGGRAFRVPTAVLRDHILSCSDLHALLMAYSQLVMHQLAQSAVCNRFHNALERMARWLLLAADRAGTNELHLTHELMGQMLGAPRSAVTEAAAKLRKQGIIEYRRGIVTIHDMTRLERVACECFGSLTRVLDEALVNETR